MFSEEQLLPISALQHLRFCERRAALVHIEGLWAENRFTAEGNQLHARAHDPSRGETRPGLRVVRGMSLRSLALGLSGKADVVELEADDAGHMRHVTLVEYKRGAPRPRYDREFQIQLCAQALCLEEMMPGMVIDAAIFYGKTRRRVAVELSIDLRHETEQTAQRLHALIAEGHTPTARYERKCDRCSMKPLCMPQALRVRATAERYLQRIITEEHGCDPPESRPLHAGGH